MGWLDAALWLIVVIWIADFILGPDGRKTLQSRLEDLWLWFDGVSWKHAGQKEANFCLAVMERLFGKRAFSLRRVLSAVTYMLLAYAAIYSASEIARIQRSLPFRWPNTEAHNHAEVPGTFIVLFVGLSLTLWICREAVMRFAGTRFETLKFTATLAVTLAVSLITHALVFPTGLTLYSLGVCEVGHVLGLEGAICSEYLSYRLWPLVWSLIWGGVSMCGYLVGHPWDLFNFFNYEFEQLVINQNAFVYSIAAGLSILLLRLGLTSFFLFGWALRRPLHKVTSLVLYRLSQSEKGVLALLAMALAALIKLLRDHLSI
jgi:hypothetical protein